jgi:hypothetical protein
MRPAVLADRDPGMRYMSAFFVVNVLQSVLAALLFAIVAWWLRRRAGLPKGAEHTKAWDVLGKGRRLRAVPSDRGSPGSLCGFAYAALLHYLFPVWWYRWGFRPALAMVAAPFVATFLLVGVVLPFVVDATLLSDYGFLVSASVQVPMRVAYGFLVGELDAEMRREALLKLGWRVCKHRVVASSAAQALERYRQINGRQATAAGVGRMRKALAALRWLVSSASGALRNTISSAA